MKLQIAGNKLLMFLFVSFVYTYVNAQSTLQDCFLFDWKPKEIVNPNYVNTALTTSSPTFTVTVDAANVLNYVSKYAYGHNAHTWAGKYNTSTLLTDEIRSLIPGTIRFPGGSLSDNYFWNATNRATCPQDLPPSYVYNDLYAGANDNVGWTMSLKDYYDLLAKTNTKGIITVNYAYARVGTSANPVAAAAHLAADWVRYDNGRTRFWEVGNEEYGKWEYGFTIDPSLNRDGQPVTNTGLNYGKHCRVFIDSMRVAAKEVGNDIKIGVVCTETPDSQWNIDLMPQIADKADYLIGHEYFTPKGSQPVSTILNAADNTKNSKDNITADFLKYGRNTNALPVALTEWNSRDTIGNQKTSVINGVFATIVLGEVAKNGYGLSARWAFLNDKHSLFGGGSVGMTRYKPYPTFFYMYYFQKMFGDKATSTTITGIEIDSVRAYSSTFSSGQVGIVLVNKGVKQRTASLKIQNFLKGKRYYYYVLQGEAGTVYSQKVLVNNQTTSESAGGPDNYATLQPYGTDITNSKIYVTIPKYGVAYVLVENDATVLKDQTITFPPFPIKFKKDNDFNPGASSSSGYDLTYSSSNPQVASIVNGKVHIVGNGTCTIQAFQSGNAFFNPAPSVFQILTVMNTAGLDTITGKTSFFIAPNPAQDMVQIILSSEESTNVEITDLLGKQLYSQMNLGRTVLIPTNSIGGKGIYLVRVNSMTKKLIIY